MFRLMFLVAVSMFPLPIVESQEPKQLPTIEQLNKEWKGKTKADVMKAYGKPTDSITLPTDPPQTTWTYKGKAISRTDTGEANHTHIFNFIGNELDLTRPIRAYKGKAKAPTAQ